MPAGAAWQRHGLGFWDFSTNMPFDPVRIHAQIRFQALTCRLQGSLPLVIWTRPVTAHNVL